MTQDFLISDQIGVWLFEPLTEAARNFMRNELAIDEPLWREQSLAVDYRDAGALAEDLADIGFTIARPH